MITLKNGQQVTEEEFYSWSKNKQHGALVGHSAETIARISEKHKALRSTEPKRVQAPETRAKIGAAQRNKPKSEEAKAKSSASQKGKFNPEALAKSVASRHASNRDRCKQPIDIILRRLVGMGYPDMSHLPRYSDDFNLDVWAQTELEKTDREQAIRLFRALQALCGPLS